MGVYHFMGLGRSPGAVTVALSYLAARYQRWNTSDQQFFAASGEVGQTTRPGNVQALVLFTTPEVRRGKVDCVPYLDNQPGSARGTGVGQPGPMLEVLWKVMRDDLRALAGGRPSVAVYWCDYDRIRPTQTFERVARTLLAVKPPGRLGKEVWVNLTGGTNVLNSAFELAASLTSVPARMYYVLSEETRCVRHTLPLAVIGSEDDTQWVELPIVHAALSEQHLTTLLEIPSKPPGMRISELYSRLKGHGEPFAHITSPEQLKLQYLVQLRSQHLIELDEATGQVHIGPRWPVLARYYEAIPEPVGTGAAESLTLDELANSEDWFHRAADLSLE